MLEPTNYVTDYRMAITTLVLDQDGVPVRNTVLIQDYNYT